MVTIKNINFSLDIMLHVLLLFTFITVFFFTYISSMTKQTLDSATNDMISNKTDILLNKMDQLSSKYNFKINREKIDNISDILITNSDGEIPKIKKNNNDLLKTTVTIIVVAFILLTTVILVLKYYYKLNIDIKHILLINFIIFSITGIIEYLFFIKVASKYNPIPPNMLLNTVLNKIKKI